MSGPGSNVSSESPDKQCINCKNERKKTLDNSIKEKESIQELDNPSRREKDDSIPDVEKNNLKKTPPLFENKEDYIVDTNYKTRVSNYSPSETGGCVSNLGEEHKNE